MPFFSRLLLHDAHMLGIFNFFFIISFLTTFVRLLPFTVSHRGKLVEQTSFVSTFLNLRTECSVYFLLTLSMSTSLMRNDIIPCRRMQTNNSKFLILHKKTKMATIFCRANSVQVLVRVNLWSNLYRHRFVELLLASDISLLFVTEIFPFPIVLHPLLLTFLPSS